MFRPAEEVYNNLESSPEWLQVFDEKRKPPLAHEMGKGAPCMKCSICPGLQLHFWRKKCTECNCSLSDHLVQDNTFPQYEVLFGDNKVRRAVIYLNGLLTKLDWSPDSREKVILDYLEALPIDRRPLTGTPGGDHRKQQLERQLPFYDLDPTLRPHLSTAAARDFQKYLANLQKNAAGTASLHRFDELDQEIYRAEPVWFEDAINSEEVKLDAPQRATINTIPCQHCSVPLQGEEVVVATERHINGLWHPKCFLCNTCNELLVDLHYFHHDGNVYCGRDYATAVNQRRCAGCDELIFETDYACADGKFYHGKHFCCWDCDEQLGGELYMHHQNKIMCLRCCQRQFSQKCGTCKKEISVQEQLIRVKGIYYHKTQECFPKQPRLQSLQGIERTE